MNNSKTIALSPNVIMKAVALLLAVTATLLLSTSSVGAAQVTTTSPARGNVSVAPGENFKLIITTDKDAAIADIEIDHNIASLPEFTLNANTADPYDGNAAAFASAGMSVVYSQAAGQWTLDFGPTVTQTIINNGVVRFYFALRDTSGATLWGGMNPTTPANTFAYTVVRGTATTVPADAEEVVIPGVPNTATGIVSSHGAVVLASLSAALVAASAFVIVTLKRQFK